MKLQRRQIAITLNIIKKSLLRNNFQKLSLLQTVIVLAIAKTESREWEIKGRQQISHTCHQQTYEFCKKIGNKIARVAKAVLKCFVSFCNIIVCFHLTASPLAPNHCCLCVSCPYIVCLAYKGDIPLVFASWHFGLWNLMLLSCQQVKNPL